MKIQKLLEALNELLEPEKFRDYCPNGLQVQGKKRGQEHRVRRFGLRGSHQ